MIEVINTEINKIENFIKNNINKTNKDSTNYRRLVKYAYHIEKIKNDFNELKNNKYDKNIEKLIINNIKNLREIIIQNHKNK